MESLPLQLMLNRSAIKPLEVQQLQEKLEIDLSDRFFSVRNQGRTEFCHAFVTADLLDEFYQFKIKDTYNSVSAFGIALESVVFKNDAQLPIQYDKPLLDRGGWVEVDLFIHFFRQSVRENLCVVKDLPGQSFFLEDNDYLTSQYGLNREMLSNQYFNELTYMQKREELFKQCKEVTPIKIEDPMALLPLIKSKNYNEKFDFNLDENTQLILENDLKQLLRANRPVAFNYDAVPIVLGYRRAEPVSHFSILVGFGEDENGGTFFKLRHSYGMDCQTPMGKKIPNCQSGYQFIKADNLLPYINYINYLEKNISQLE